MRFINSFDLGLKEEESETAYGPVLDVAGGCCKSQLRDGEKEREGGSREKRGGKFFRQTALRL